MSAPQAIPGRVQLTLHMTRRTLYGTFAVGVGDNYVDG